jgi:hypothetical protein
MLKFFQSEELKPYVHHDPIVYTVTQEDGDEKGQEAKLCKEVTVIVEFKNSNLNWMIEKDKAETATATATPSSTGKSEGNGDVPSKTAHGTHDGEKEAPEKSPEEASPPNRNTLTDLNVQVPRGQCKCHSLYFLSLFFSPYQFVISTLFFKLFLLFVPFLPSRSASSCCGHGWIRKVLDSFCSYGRDAPFVWKRASCWHGCVLRSKTMDHELLVQSVFCSLVLCLYFCLFISFFV